MKKFKVILGENHTAREDQVMTHEGDVCLGNGIFPSLYTRGHAVKKASTFKGTIKAHSSKYEIAEDYRVAQINGDNIPMSVITALETCCSFIDKDKSIGEKLYDVGSIGDDLLPNATGDLKIELMDLYQSVIDYSYVTFLKC